MSKAKAARKPRAKKAAPQTGDRRCPGCSKPISQAAKACACGWKEQPELAGLPVPTPSDEQRRRYLGGSDAPGAIGASRFETPLAVYLKKRGEILPEEIREADEQRERDLYRGKLMEPVILQMLERDWDLEVTRRSSEQDRNYHAHPQYDFLRAEIDAEWRVTPKALDAFEKEGHDVSWLRPLEGSIQNCEIKSMNPLTAYRVLGEEGTDEILVEHFTQAVHGLMVSGRQATLVAVGSGWEPRVFWVRRDEPMIAGVRAKLVAFWEQHVLAGVRPGPVNVPDVYRLLRRRPATKWEASAEAIALVATLKKLRERQKNTEAAIKGVEYEIGCAMLGAPGFENPTEKEAGRHVITIGGRPALNVSHQKQKRIDAELLRERYPEAAEACEKTSQFFRFHFPRSKS